ncbi:MAG: hypothetical protein ACE5K9_12740 [Candidatus Methylomirabilales bacterium]
MRVILLGTGFPRPNPNRRGPSQLLEVAGERFLVDCGSGVACQLVAAGVSPLDIRRPSELRPDSGGRPKNY